MIKGKDGVVKMGTPLASIGWLQSWNIDLQADQVAGWGMGDSYETSFTTIARWSGSCEVYLDFADASASLAIGDELAIEFYPGGEATGSGYFSGNACITSLAKSGAKDGIAMLTINFASRGPLAEGVAP